MNDITEDDILDRRLREAAPYIDDDGFTARVLQQLPVARQRLSLRAIIMIGITLLASALAYKLSNGGAFVAANVTANVVRLTSLPVLWLCLAALGSALLATAGAAAAAIFQARRSGAA